jgi:hypothetical protein
VWLCAWATTDGKSGSSTVIFLKQLSHFGYENVCENLFEMNPACVCLQNEPQYDPYYTLCMILLISPSVGGVGFAEYVVCSPLFY